VASSTVEMAPHHILELLFFPNHITTKYSHQHNQTILHQNEKIICPKTKILPSHIALCPLHLLLSCDLVGEALILSQPSFICKKSQNMSILWNSTWLRLSDCLGTAFDMFMWISGPLFIFIAVVLIGGCVFLYFAAIVPYMFPTWSLLYVVNMIIAMWLLSNITFNYFACVFTRPGSPKPLQVLDFYEDSIAHCSS